MRCRVVALSHVTTLKGYTVGTLFNSSYLPFGMLVTELRGTLFLETTTHKKICRRRVTFLKGTHRKQIGNVLHSLKGLIEKKKEAYYIP